MGTDATTNGRPGAPALPRGRHRIPRELVVQNQRERLIAGVGQALGENGYAALTVSHVVAAAEVSRLTFYQHFENKQDAVLAAHEAAFERLLCRILRACNAQREWPYRVKRAIGATLNFAAAEPDRARLLTLNATASDAAIGRRALASREHFAALLAAGREHSSTGFPLPQVTELALIAGIAGIVAAVSAMMIPARSRGSSHNWSTGLGPLSRGAGGCPGGAFRRTRRDRLRTGCPVVSVRRSRRSALLWRNDLPFPIRATLGQDRQSKVLSV